jgi:hypothetical protein
MSHSARMGNESCSFVTGAAGSARYRASSSTLHRKTVCSAYPR